MVAQWIWLWYCQHMHALLTSSLVPLVLAVMLLNHYPDVGSKAAGVKEKTFAYPV